MADPSQYPTFLKEAQSIARTAGAIIKDAFTNRGSLEIDLKNENDADLVTQCDRKVEALIFNHLKTTFPTHKFVGEETVSESESKTTGLDETPTWVVDPIDGTTNFVHGFPFVAVAIGLVVKKEPVVGVVFNPIMDEMFHAVKGQGAFLNDVALPLPPVRPLKSLARALVASEYGADRVPEIVDPKMRTLHKVIADPVRGVRTLGSCALTMCYVARASLDCYWEAGVHAWDVAAAAIIVREAGGIVVNWDQQETEQAAGGREYFDICSRNVLCVRKTAGEGEGAAILKTVRAAIEPVTYARD
ncbi:inositol monophosphatase 1-like protein [Phlyctochytrium arcticum]|nr:inositol monophosphatase 1-like protein [Phlyctochytrium arcticum]